jgi:3-hydroxybutyryl-CoA dehydrogenase
MGPCELMDLIGHDTNFAVTQSVYEANFFDKRYMPSLVQREMVDGGLLGRKSGRGFYRYPEDPPEPRAPARIANVGTATVHGQGAIADMLAERLPESARVPGSDWVGLQVGTGRLMLTDGRCAAERAALCGALDVALFDRPLQGPTGALAYALAPGTSEDWQAQAPAWLRAAGFEPERLADAPGLAVARTVAMLVNEAADAVLQGVCSTEGADAAMKLGVNYPAGPFEWLARWDVAGVAGVLQALDAFYRGERYRLSPWLRRH